MLEVNKRFKEDENPRFSSNEDRLPGKGQKNKAKKGTAEFGGAQEGKHVGGGHGKEEEKVPAEGKAKETGRENLEEAEISEGAEKSAISVFEHHEKPKGKVHKRK